MQVALVSGVVIFIAVVSSVSATWLPRCDEYVCDKAMCPSRKRCRCGVHLDYCGCCKYCYKCPKEECNPVFNHLCSPGFYCELDDNIRSFAAGGMGHCRPHDDSGAFPKRQNFPRRP
ncbi:hypothetical protein V5799_012351 [Amblyomma americanum]|uniref:Metastriate insulin growth factor binding protein n=1 Tax=Amblyomma americanum TaxID=6943 RepID=A0AAQ4EEE6_AMBAM